MSAPNSPKTSPQTMLEAGVSQLSLSSSNQGDDWDKSLVEGSSEPVRPSTPLGQNHAGGETENTPQSEAKSRRSLSDLLRMHVEKGRDLKLSDEDEARLSEELGKWINSDSSPYEIDASDTSDDAFAPGNPMTREPNGQNDDNHKLNDSCSSQPTSAAA